MQINCRSNGTDTATGQPWAWPGHPRLLPTSTTKTWMAGTEPAMTRRRSCRLAEQFTADQHPPDLAGAGADLVQLGVAQQTPGRIVVDVAVAAQALDRLESHPRCLFRGI